MTTSASGAPAGDRASDHANDLSRDRVRSARISWAKFAARALVILAIGMFPWPGLGRAWSACYCDVANAIGPLALPTETAQFRFQPGDDPDRGEEAVPWQVYVYARRVSTGQVDRSVHKGRLSYLSLLTFLALAISSAFQRRKTAPTAVPTARMWLVGLPALLSMLALSDLSDYVLVLDRWGWLPLSPAVVVALYTAHIVMNGLPSMTFATPGLIWFATRRWPFSPQAR
jgi:hypothetical protein